MAEIEVLQAALFTRIVTEGEINPCGEADFKGYERVTFIAMNGKNLSSIDFPRAQEDYPIPVLCVAALDFNNKVRGVLKTVRRKATAVSGKVDMLSIHDFSVFSQGIMDDGPVILKYGQPLTPEEIVQHLNKLTNALAFYSDPETYHAIAFLPDNPAGDFMTDFSENEDYDYSKPGARARITFTDLNI